MSSEVAVFDQHISNPSKLMTSLEGNCLFGRGKTISYKVSFF